MRYSVTVLAIFLTYATVGAQQDKTAKRIIENAVKAHGGEQNILKLRVAEVKYTLWLFVPGVGEADMTVHDLYQLPTQFKKVTKGKQGVKDIDLTWAVLNGGEKWWWRNGSGQSATVNERRDIESLYRPYLVLEMIVNISKDPDAKIVAFAERKDEKRLLVGFEFTRQDGPSTLFLFDKESGLLALTEEKKKLPGADKEGLQRTFLSEYKTVNGAVLFHRQVSIHDAKKVGEVRVTAVNTLEKVDEKVFAGP